MSFRVFTLRILKSLRIVVVGYLLNLCKVFEVFAIDSFAIDINVYVKYFI